MVKIIFSDSSEYILKSQSRGKVLVWVTDPL